MAKFITSCQHEYGADARLKSFDDYEKAVEHIHKFFLSYDFEIRDGRPYDSGNAAFEGDEGGFSCISAAMHNGKVCSFTHCDGDGPIGEIREEEED